MHKILLLPCFITSTVLLSGSFIDINSIQGDGILKKEARNTANFNQININGKMNVLITCQKQKLIDIEGDSNIVSLLKTSVKNNILSLNLDKKYKENNPLNIHINIPDVSILNINGSSKISIEGIKNNNLNIAIHGVSDLTAKGQSKKLSLDVSGAGYIDTKNLKSENTKVELKGTSMVDVFASKNLDANISGFGKINYYGNPQNIKKNISGAGFITQARKTG